MGELIFQGGLKVFKTLVDSLRIDCACLRFVLTVLLNMGLKPLDFPLELFKLLVHVLLSDVISGD